MTQLAVGAAVDFAGLTLPFTIADLIESGNALIKYVGPFVLLGLAFMFAPKVFALIKKGFATSNKS